MSLANYKPVAFYAGLNKVTFPGTEDEIPMDTPLYYMAPVGNLKQVKEASDGVYVYSGLNSNLLIGRMPNVQLYYDTHGLMMTGTGGKRKIKSNRTKKRKTKRR